MITFYSWFLSLLGEILDTKFAFCYHDIKSFRNECIATMEKICLVEVRR